MKRRGFLKMLGIGAAVPPDVQLRAWLVDPATRPIVTTAVPTAAVAGWMGPRDEIEDMPGYTFGPGNRMTCSVSDAKPIVITLADWRRSREALGMSMDDA